MKLNFVLSSVKEMFHKEKKDTWGVGVIFHHELTLKNRHNPFELPKLRIFFPRI